jgi:hypothetical protein
MSRDDALVYILNELDAGGEATPASNYARRVLKHLDGELKNMPSPSAAVKEVGKEIRERVKGEYLKTPVPEPFTFSFRTPSRYSATFLGKAEDCLLGAALDRDMGATGKPATLGSVTHEVCRAIGEQVFAEGMTTIRPETAQKLASVHMGAMNHHPLSHEHYLQVLELVGTWAMIDTFWPDAELWLLEELMTRTVGEHTYSGQIDRIEIRDGHGRVTDYKTGYRAPSVEQFKRRIQTPLYAWLADEMFAGVHTWEVREVYLRSGIIRDHTFEMGELQIDGYLKVSADRLKRVYERNEWSERAGTVTPGDHCENCAFPLLCPTAGHNPYAMVTTMDEAKDVLSYLVSTEAIGTQMKKMLRAFTEREGDPVQMNGMEAGFFPKSEFERIDKDKVAAYVADHGDNPDEFFNITEATTEFRIRKEKDGT